MSKWSKEFLRIDDADKAASVAVRERRGAWLLARAVEYDAIGAASWADACRALANREPVDLHIGASILSDLQAAL